MYFRKIANIVLLIAATALTTRNAPAQSNVKQIWNQAANADACTVVVGRMETENFNLPLDPSKITCVNATDPAYNMIVSNKPALSTQIDVIMINNGACTFLLAYNAQQSGLTDDMYRWVIKFYDTNLIRPLDHDKAFGYMKLTYTKPISQ
jgi:hypothetical protein